MTLVVHTEAQKRVAGGIITEFLMVVRPCSLLEGRLKQLEIDLILKRKRLMGILTASIVAKLYFLVLKQNKAKTGHRKYHDMNNQEILDKIKSTFETERQRNAEYVAELQAIINVQRETIDALQKSIERLRHW
jgi:uncharacterized protein YlxW (UPF0749 family)